MGSAEIIILSSSPVTSPVQRSKPSPRSRTIQNRRVAEVNNDFDFFAPEDAITVDKSGVSVSPRTSTEKHNNIPKQIEFKARVPVRLNSSPSNLHRDSAIFDDSLFEEHDLPVDQPAKKRKLSPFTKQKPEVSLASKALASVDIFDLSSEPDLACQRTDDQESPVADSDNVSVHDLAVSDEELPDMADLMKRARPMVNVSSRPLAGSELVEILSDENDDAIITSSQVPRTQKAGRTSTSKERGPTTVEGRHRKSASRASNTSTGISSYAKISKATTTLRPAKEIVDNIVDSSQPTRARSPTKKSKRSSDENKADVERKRAEKLRKAAGKEAEKEQKRLDKEQKAIEKQRQADIAEVNKRKTDKKQTVEEMIIDLPKVLKGKSLGNKVEEEIENLGAEFTYYADELDMTGDASEAKSVGNIIKWRRKTNATYDPATEEWVPLPTRKTVPEKHILVHLPGEDFGLVAAGYSSSTKSSAEIPTEDEMKGNLDIYMALLRSKFPDYTIVILIDGLQTWLKKHVTAKNRDYTAAVRAQPNAYEQPDSSAPSASQPASSARSKKRKPNKPDLSFFTAELAEDLLLHLQLMHQPLHIQHAITSHTYQEVIAFTQQLSTRPYRAAELDRNLANASFCMASGQFKSGQGDAKETWRLMLEQVNRLTVSMAKGIINEGYDSPAALISAFEKIEKSGTGGGRSLSGDTAAERKGRERVRVMLQDVKRSINKVGDRGDKRLGPQISKRLYKVFMSRDPDMRDGIA